MASLILTTAVRYLLPLILLFSLFIVSRGHNAPGGGFAGGLIAAAGLSLYALAEGVDAARRLLRVDPRLLVGTGLLTAVISGGVALAAGAPFLTGQWIDVSLGQAGILHLGTPLLFDAGVYLVVLGVSLMIVFSLAEEAG